MKFLLIDFGATFIKCAIYNKSDDSYRRVDDIASPFATKVEISKSDLLDIFSGIISANEKVDGIIICTILGGCYIGDVYFSWKSPDCKKGNKCMVSGLLDATPHIHHKPFTSSEKYLDKLEVIGYIASIPVYSSLGDTDCVIKSIDLDPETVAVNMGTGSQVISQNAIHRYFPCGRMLLVYERFFADLGVDMFNLFDSIEVEDVITSTLEMDLNVFPQSRNYYNGGDIIGIKESNFNLSNLLGSLLKHLILQYGPYIAAFDKILLLGGVAKKIQILPSLFEHYYAPAKVFLVEGDIESPHRGLISFIKEYL